jgi:bacterioferritin-associated ferredoxin
MIVCVCLRISDRQITIRALEGCQSFDELQFDTGVATRCGTCRPFAVEVFEQQRATAASRVVLPGGWTPLPACERGPAVAAHPS